MINFDELRITPTDPLVTSKWNGMVDEIERFPTNLTDQKLTISNQPLSTEIELAAGDTKGTPAFVVKAKSGSSNNNKLLMGIRGDFGDFILCGRTNPTNDPKKSSCRAMVDYKDLLCINYKEDFKKGVQIGGQLKIQTKHGRVNIGPANTGWCHIDTDRSKFYFNQEIRVNTGKIGSYKKDLHLCVEGKIRTTISSNRGYIIMRNNANNDEAKKLLKTVSNHQLIIGGAWDTGVYFYWKDKKGKNRRAIVRGSTF